MSYRRDDAFLNPRWLHWRSASLLSVSLRADFLQALTFFVVTFAEVRRASRWPGSGQPSLWTRDSFSNLIFTVFFTGLFPSLGIYPLSRGLRPQFCMGSDEYESDFSWKFFVYFLPSIFLPHNRFMLCYDMLTFINFCSVWFPAVWLDGCESNISLSGCV